MKTKIRGILALFFALIVQVSFAQEKTITGTVSDNSGTLPGVTVLLKGSTSGSETDFDGKYTIKAKQGDILVFSYLGYKTQEKTVGSSNIIDVRMVDDANILDEIVVTGVASGTSKKKLGVSVNSVSAKDLETPGSQSIEQALQGKIAGTIIQSTSGQPGQQQNIILRAINSLNSSQPMILIDGVQILTSSSSIGGASNQSSRLSDIDFSTIERVETISGAAAGTIYGAQGANGVINIITKKGKAGKMQVNVRSDFSVVNAIAGDNLKRSGFHRYQTDAQGFLVDLNGTRVTTLNAESQYGAVAINPVTVGTTQLGAAGINNTPYAEQTFDATDVLFSTAINQIYGVNLSGGTDKATYLIAANRTEQESVLVDGNYTKYDARFNLGVNLTDNFKVNARFDVINSRNNTGTNTDNANAFNLINNVFQNLPHVNLDVINSDGDLVVQPDLTDPNSTNPFFYRRIQTRQDEISRYIANVNLNYKATDYLNFDIKYGYDYYTQNFTFFQENKSNHQQASAIGGSVTGRINQITNQEYFQNFIASANLVLNLKDQLGWNTNAVSTTTVTFDWRDRNVTSSSVSGTDNPFGVFGSFNINQSNTKVFNGFSSSPFRTYGYLINQKVDFGSLFGFSAGVRQDYSNRFGSGLDFTFPRADAYFNISDTFESDFLEVLKVRAAYGEAGIQPPFGGNLITVSGTPLGGSDVGLAFPAQLSNENLEVETTSELEIGFDYSVSPNDGDWFSSIYGFMNYFTRSSDGVIFTAEAAPSSGASNVIDNAYEISSNGIEFSANTKMYQAENFSWDFGLRFSTSKATLDNIKSGQPLVINDNFVLEGGQEIGTFSLFKVLTSLDETDLQGNLIIPTADQGDFTVASSGYVVNRNTGNVAITPDKRTLGSSQPDFVMTFINDFQINDWINVSFQLDWFQGLDVYNNARQWLYNNGLHADTSEPITINDPTGVDQTGAFVQYYTSLYNTNVPLSHFLEDASFLRLRNISVGVNLKKFIKADFIDSFNVRLSGRNLMTFTNYTGLDPEASRSFGNTFQRGFDEFTHPNTKSINLGVNITF